MYNKPKLIDFILKNRIKVDELLAIDQDEAPVATNMINMSVINTMMNHSVSILQNQPLNSNFMGDG